MREEGKCMEEGRLNENVKGGWGYACVKEGEGSACIREGGSTSVEGCMHWGGGGLAVSGGIGEGAGISPLESATSTYPSPFAQHRFAPTRTCLTLDMIFQNQRRATARVAKVVYQNINIFLKLIYKI